MGPKWWVDGASYIYGKTYVSIVKETNMAARIDPGVAKAIEVAARERYHMVKEYVPSGLIEACDVPRT